MLLTKDAILSAQDLTFEDVEVKEWGGSVRVRVMTASERDEFESQVFKTKGKDVEYNQKNFRSKLLVMTLADENNNKLFTENEVDKLASKSSVPIDKLCQVAMKLNAIGAKDVEDLTKN